MATGSQILSYQGNAGLAAGTAGADGSIPITGAIGIKDPTGEVDATLKQMQDHSFEWNTLKHAQAIRDRDELYKLFASNRIDFPVDDNDRPVVQGQIDKIKTMMTANPNMNDKKNQNQLRAEFSTLAAMKAAAQGKNADLVLLRNDIANEVNPMLRKRKQDHYDAMRIGDLNTQVKPFQQEASWDTKTLFPAGKKKTKTTTWVDEKTKYPMKQTDEISDMSWYRNNWSIDSMLPSEKNIRPFQARNMTDEVYTNPIYQDPKYLNQQNKKIVEINKQAGLINTDADWLAPIARFEVYDPATGEGSGAFTLEDNPLEMGRSIHAIGDFSYTPGSPVIDQEAIDAKKKTVDIEGVETSTKNAKADQEFKKRKEDLEISKLEQEIEDKRSTTEARDQKTAANQEFALGNLKDVRAVFQYNDNVGQFKERSAMPTPAMNDAMKFYPKFGIGVDWTMAEMPHDPNAEKILTDAKKEDLGNGKISLKYTSPDRIYMVRAPDGNVVRSMLVGAYDTTIKGADGAESTTTTYKAYRRDQAGTRLISANKGYDQTSEAYQDAVGLYRKLWFDVMDKGETDIKKKERLKAEAKAEEQRKANMTAEQAKAEREKLPIGTMPAGALDATSNTGEKVWVLPDNTVIYQHGGDEAFKFSDEEAKAFRDDFNKKNPK